jgi:hypothetical protein
MQPDDLRALAHPIGRATLVVVLSAAMAAACARPAAHNDATQPAADRSSSAPTSPVLTASGRPSPSGTEQSAQPAQTQASLPPAVPAAPADLPRGGRQIFPQHRVVAHYGTPDTGVLGVLGEGSPATAAVRLERSAAAFTKPGGKPVLPAFELIVTVADAHPGADGGYSHPISDESIARYVAAARKAKALVILDVQPGRANMIAEVKRYQKWLVQPDIGLAIDPEWAVRAGEVPGRVIGRVDASTVNAVSGYLASLTAQHHLPQKLFVVHQFRAAMITHRSAVVARPALATVFHIDGFGTPGQKLEVYAALKAPRGFYNGFKLFIDEDRPTLSPAQAMRLTPRPDLVTYQ